MQVVDQAQDLPGAEPGRPNLEQQVITDGFPLQVAAEAPPTQSDWWTQKRTALYRSQLEVAEKLRAAGLDTVAGRIERCGVTESLYFCSNCGHTHYVPYHCGNRLCPACAAYAAQKRTQALRALYLRMSRPKFLTLTMTRATTLRDGVQRILKAFRRWRNLRSIKARILGGVYKIEWKAKPDGWHVHLHALIDAHYIPFPLLVATWAHAIDQSHASVELRDARNVDVAREIAKYVAKPADLRTMTTEQVAEVATTIRHTRTLSAFGKYYCVSLQDLAYQEDPHAYACPHCGATGCVYPLAAGPLVFGEHWNDVYEAIMTTGPPERLRQDIPPELLEAARAAELFFD